MTDPAKDAAAEARIISHMNADHQDSLVRYLEHYAQLPRFTAATARLTSLTLSSLTLSSAAGPRTIALSPPMASFRDARERLVALDKECVAALGRSDVTVRDFTLPRGGWAVLWLAIAGAWFAYSSRANFAPHTGVVGKWLPEGLRRLCYTLQPAVIWFMIVAHGAETVVMIRGRLRRHNVNMRSLTYWLWVADVAIEGFGGFIRFDRLVEQKRIEKERQKH